MQPGDDPDTSSVVWTSPLYLTSTVKWTSTVSSKLLVEGGYSSNVERHENLNQPGIAQPWGTASLAGRRTLPRRHAWDDESRRFRMRQPAAATIRSLRIGLQPAGRRHRTSRARTTSKSASSIRGARDGNTLRAERGPGAELPERRAVHRSVLEATGQSRERTGAERLNANLGIYAQDQWTFKRLTLNYARSLGIRQRAGRRPGDAVRTLQHDSGVRRHQDAGLEELVAAGLGRIRPDRRRQDGRCALASTGSSTRPRRRSPRSTTRQTPWFISIDSAVERQEQGQHRARHHWAAASPTIQRARSTSPTCRTSFLVSCLSLSRVPIRTSNARMRTPTTSASRARFWSGVSLSFDYFHNDAQEHLRAQQHPAAGHLNADGTRHQPELPAGDHLQPDRRPRHHDVRHRLSQPSNRRSRTSTATTTNLTQQLRRLRGQLQRPVAAWRGGSVGGSATDRTISNVCSAAATNPSLLNYCDQSQSGIPWRTQFKLFATYRSAVGRAGERCVPGAAGVSARNAGIDAGRKRHAEPRRGERPGFGVGGRTDDEAIPCRPGNSASLGCVVGARVVPGMNSATLSVPLIASRHRDDVADHPARPRREQADQCGQNEI